MAEVARVLRSGLHRLSALESSRGGALRAGRGSAGVRVNRSVRESDRDDGEVQPGSESRGVHIPLRESGRYQQQLEDGGLFCTSMDADSVEFMRFVRTRDRILAHKRPAQVQASVRMSSWTRGAVSIHPDPCRVHQQIRALCTVFFILSKQQRQQRPDSGQRLKLHFTGSRSYSWSGSSSKDVPLHRSRTAYYDILKVSPAATQTQIKTAYYKQSFLYHPDKNPGSKEASHQFSQINEAYTVLGNIALRRKYNRGLLNQTDVQNAGRPSSREARSSSKPHQDRARRFSQPGGRPLFDFDAFYQAHYGEQLQREKVQRAMRERMQQMQKKRSEEWGEDMKIEATVFLVLSVGVLCLLTLYGP